MKSYLAPQGRVLTPYICCRDAARAIEWYIDVFGARLTSEPFMDPDGRVGHAELEIDDAVIMLSDAYPDLVEAPAADRLPTYALNLYLPDVDATTAAAERAGATVERPPADAFHGARSATVLDPFGIRWMLATQVREVSDEEFDAARTDFAEG
ncbi:glyoxalase/bleomycin resistance/extradiol dioxygenase family protein [Kribbella sp. NPDC051952]|uniref:VOC family protein n=1 Tax=Kribbella sp. NPDC051952 TaxID=3154851 RepID=UPI003443805E